MRTCTTVEFDFAEHKAELTRLSTTAANCRPIFLNVDILVGLMDESIPKLTNVRDFLDPEWQGFFPGPIIKSSQNSRSFVEFSWAEQTVYIP